MSKSPLSLSAARSHDQMSGAVSSREINWQGHVIGVAWGIASSESVTDRPVGYDFRINGMASHRYFDTLKEARATLTEELSAHHLYGDPKTFALAMAIVESDIDQVTAGYLFGHMAKTTIDPYASVRLSGADGKILTALDTTGFFQMNYDLVTDSYLVRRTALLVTA